MGSCGQCNNLPGQIKGLKCTVQPFKALGVYFSKDYDESLELKFTNRLTKCKISLNIWAQQNLTLKGKILILKTIIIPNLHYVTSNLFTSDVYIKEVDRLLFNFIWNNKPPKIKKETVIADIEQGELRMPHFESIVWTAKIMWVRRLVNTEKESGNN